MVGKIWNGIIESTIEQDDQHHSPRRIGFGLDI